MTAHLKRTVREWRKRRGWGVETVSQFSGIHRSTLYRIERGEITNPSHATVCAIAGALRVSPDALVFAASPDRAIPTEGA